MSWNNRQRAPPPPQNNLSKLRGAYPVDKRSYYSQPSWIGGEEEWGGDSRSKSTSSYSSYPSHPAPLSSSYDSYPRSCKQFFLFTEIFFHILQYFSFDLKINFLINFFSLLNIK